MNSADVPDSPQLRRLGHVPHIQLTMHAARRTQQHQRSTHERTHVSVCVWSETESWARCCLREAPAARAGRDGGSITIVTAHGCLTTARITAPHNPWQHRSVAASQRRSITDAATAAPAGEGVGGGGGRTNIGAETTGDAAGRSLAKAISYGGHIQMAALVVHGMEAEGEGGWGMAWDV